MHKRAGVILVLAGAVLILAALLLVFSNYYEDRQAGRESDERLIDVRAIIEERITPAPLVTPAAGQEAGESAETPEPFDPELTVVEIDGHGYIGYLSIPVLELDLPIMSEWDYEKLKIAPCRQFGSSKTDDLVIAAHNYKRHFGYLAELEAGDAVLFTDMDGTVNTYEVALVDTLNPTEVEAVQNSGYDLVLYTCTYGGKTRVTVFCNRSAGEVHPEDKNISNGEATE